MNRDKGLRCHSRLCRWACCTCGRNANRERVVEVSAEVRAISAPRPVYVLGWPCVGRN